MRQNQPKQAIDPENPDKTSLVIDDRKAPVAVFHNVSRCSSNVIAGMQNQRVWIHDGPGSHEYLLVFILLPGLNSTITAPPEE
jgi:hypothetical protein